MIKWTCEKPGMWNAKTEYNYINGYKKYLITRNKLGWEVYEVRGQSHLIYNGIAKNFKQAKKAVEKFIEISKP